MDLLKTEHRDAPTAVDEKIDVLNEYFLRNIRQEHPLDGFSFDSSLVSTQYAAVDAAMGMYHTSLLNGLVEDVDATIKEYRAALETAGIKDILAELDKQINEYLATK